MFVPLCDTFHSLGKLDKAMECYRKVIRYDPESAAVDCNLGNIFTEKFELNEAIAC